MNKELAEQVAVVTGAGTGIGKAISLELASRGATLVLIGRTAAKLEDTKAEIQKLGGTAEVCPADVTDREAIFKIRDFIVEKYGQVQILVSNAGHSTAFTYSEKMPVEDWHSIMNTHLTGAWNCIQAFISPMKQNHYGRIVFMSSLGGRIGLATQANYGTAKAGLVGMTYSLAKELGQFGITVNNIQPGIIETHMTAGVLENFRERLTGLTPVKAIGTPEDVANAVGFFCSPGSSFLTGITLPVDGGFHLAGEMDALLLHFTQQMDQSK